MVDTVVPILHPLIAAVIVRVDRGRLSGMIPYETAQGQLIGVVDGFCANAIGGSIFRTRDNGLADPPRPARSFLAECLFFSLPPI